MDLINQPLLCTLVVNLFCKLVANTITASRHETITYNLLRTRLYYTSVIIYILDVTAFYTQLHFQDYQDICMVAILSAANSIIPYVFERKIALSHGSFEP